MRKRYQFLARMGVRGTVKTLLETIKSNISPGHLLLHRNVITEIEGELNIEGVLTAGLSTPNVSHSKIGGSKISIGKNGTLNIASGWTNIGPCCVIAVEDEGELSIGDSYLNSDCRIVCAEEISIGDGCAIAWNVDIVDSDMHSMIYDGEKQKGTAPIEIKNNVWVGSNVTIKKGVTIGSGSVIASGSTVTDNVPENCLAAGSPAEVKRENVDWGGIKK